VLVFFSRRYMMDSPTVMMEIVELEELQPTCHLMEMIDLEELAPSCHQ
jgi:hypothetical protein